MKKIVALLRDHIRQTTHFRLLAGLAIIIFISVYGNYKLDFEDGVIDQLPGLFRIPGMLGFHFIPYLLVAILITPYATDRKWYLSSKFWIIAIPGFLILSVDRSLQIRDVVSSMVEPANAYFINSFIKRILSLGTIVIPLLILSYFTEKSVPGLGYGLKADKFNPKPYLILLAFAGLAIIIGGMFRDIQEYYPRFIELGGEEFAVRNNIPLWLCLIIYELAYATDFISVEMFFRGFLIYGFTRFFGAYAVYPMIVTYCFLHFGKPATEAISSVFGGYILGVISLKSRTIWGGILIHVGIAWLMEIVGYLYR